MITVAVPINKSDPKLWGNLSQLQKAPDDRVGGYQFLIPQWFRSMVLTLLVLPGLFLGVHL